MTASTEVPRIAPPQAFISSYAPRLRAYANALITPIAPPTTVLPPVRTTKRGTTAINYAEDGYGSDFDEDTDGALSRRPTGLRSRREDVGSHASGGDRIGAGGSGVAGQQGSQYGKQTNKPVNVQGIWREWIGKPKPAQRTEKQAQTQCLLPLHLIPIRIDVDVGAWRPEAALPTPPNSHLNDMSSAYRPSELTPGFRLKDVFLWNLHEALLTPEQFARVFVEEMDFAVMHRAEIIRDIARQIRDQLESHAVAALHPLFQVPETEPKPVAQQQQQHQRISNGTNISTKTNANGTTPSSAPAPPHTVTATLAASPILDPSTNNPPDTHRCILTLSIPLSTSHLYTDRFEWSLAHPPGHAETFARLTTADLGLPSEYTPHIAHAIYEAVLRLKKEAAENAASSNTGMLNAGGGANTLLFSTGDPLNNTTGNIDNPIGIAAIGGHLGLDNDAARPLEGAGWRYDPDELGREWEPKLEALSKEEIEKREGDRERRLRRARRETARLAGDGGGGAGEGYGAGGGSYGGGSSRRGRDYGGAGLGMGIGLGDSFTPVGTTTNRGSTYGTPDVEDPNASTSEALMGRGHRYKKKRRFRSLSPEAGGENGTSSNQGSGAATGGPLAGIGVLSEAERGRFRCAHCGMPGSGVWCVRDGPEGKGSLCQVCGWLWEGRGWVFEEGDDGVDGESERERVRAGMWKGNEGIFAGEGSVVAGGGGGGGGHTRR